MPQPRLQFLFCLLAYTLILRVLPYVLHNCDIQTDPSILYYPWSFSPLTAVCLFGGAFLADRRLSLLLPLATVFISDLGIAALSGRPDWAFPVNSSGEFEIMRLAGVGMRYSGFALAVVAGFLLRNWQPRRLAATAVATGLTYEIVFFAVSNFLVWCWPSEAPLYPLTAAGLMQCYVAGLPFLGKALASTAIFTLLMFSPLGVRAASEATDASATGKLEPVRVK